MSRADDSGTASLAGTILADSVWEGTPTDPDPHRHLGYQIQDWQVVEPGRDSDTVAFMPESREELRDDAFLVADRDAVCDLDDRR